jgi:hypothetical protein
MGVRGRKKPGWPNIMALAAPMRWPSASQPGTPAVGMPKEGRALLVMRCQNSCRRAVRRPGGLPAMRLALMAPMETPATQLGATPYSESAW